MDRVAHYVFRKGGTESTLGIGPATEAEAGVSLRKLLPHFKKLSMQVITKYLVPEPHVFFKKI